MNAPHWMGMITNSAVDYESRSETNRSELRICVGTDNAKPTGEEGTTISDSRTTNMNIPQYTKNMESKQMKSSSQRS